MALTAAQVIAQFGAFYKDGGQSVKDLIFKIQERLEHEKMFHIIHTKDTVIRRSNVSVGSVLQNYQKQFTPKGGLDFTPVEIVLGHVKIDDSITPHDLEETWLGFLSNEDVDPSKWPVVKVWLTELIKQAKKDFELNEWYKGVYAAPTPGTASGVGETINGVRKLINDDIAGDAKMNVIATGALETDAKLFVTQIEDFVNQIPENIVANIKHIGMSNGKSRLFRQGMREKYNMNYQQTSNITELLDYNISVVGSAGQTGNKIFCTVDKNLVKGMKKPKNSQVFDIQKQDREVKALTDWYQGIGFLIPELVYTNDQDLV